MHENNGACNFMIASTHWKNRDSLCSGLISQKSKLELANKLDLSPTLVEILCSRGYNTLKEIDEFLSPHLRYLNQLNTFQELNHCASIIADCLLENKKCLVWGDYDVDGITSTTLVLDVLENHGFLAEFHIPTRKDEGYGLNIAQIEKYAKEGIKLLITVDCGISDCAEIKRARELGITVVISDHHLPPPTLPDANGICNPRIQNGLCPHLAGVGVAFYLMSAVNNILEKHTGHKFDMREVLDLVALGTLADMVYLSKQNRILVKNGLLKVGSANRLGIVALKKVSDLNATAPLTSGQIVFKLAPRINAAGRMAEGSIAVNLLRTKDYDEALTIANNLNKINLERKQKEIIIQAEAREEALKYDNSHSLVLFKKDWHSGILGIIASRMVNEFNKPTLILCQDANTVKGSGRSIAGFDLHNALTKFEDILLRYGGHKLAVGLQLNEENLEELRARFEQHFIEDMGEEKLKATTLIDRELDFATVSDFTFLKELELMQPFGTGNAEPTFAINNLIIKGYKIFGRNKEHINLELLDTATNITLRAKLWHKAKYFSAASLNKAFKMAFSVTIDKYNGIANISLNVKDYAIVE